MSKSVKGVAPGFLLMPAREYEWELVRRITIKVPNNGGLTELCGNEQVANNLKIEGENEFLVFDGKLLLLWEVVRVLFAAIKYPTLEDSECFNVVGIEVDEGENSVVLHGEIIRNVG